MLNCSFDFTGVVICDEDLSRLPWNPRCSPAGYSLQVKKEIHEINIQLLTLFLNWEFSSEASYQRYTASYSALIFTQTQVKGDWHFL